MTFGEYEFGSLSFDAPEIDSDSIVEAADLFAEIPLSSNQITFQTEASFCDFVNLFGTRIPSAIQFTVPEVYGYVQARTHKKRRINKKWLKRYGYREIIRDALYKGEIADEKVTTEDNFSGMPFMMDVNIELTNIQRIGWCDI